jgi:murein L,D-transpeptidase YcbB/YkuD
VPLYITYLTAVPSGTQFAFYDDVYGRNAQSEQERRRGRVAA